MNGPLSSTLLRFVPLAETISSYKREYLRRDVVSALTVAIVAIPQSMAYAIIAGVNPVYGLYSVIVSTILGAVFGSSSHLIAGATNAISLLVASSMRNYMGLDSAYEMLFLMTFMVGALQILFGVIKLGKVVNYVSHAVVVGFTAGAGVLIAFGQLNQILGIPIQNAAQMPTLNKVAYVLTHLDQTNIYALGLGLLTIAIILLCSKINRNLPGSLLGILIPIAFIIYFALEKSGVKLTGTIPASLPPFKMITLDMGMAREMFSGALAIAIIGLVEAISIAKSIAATSRERIDANQEFIAQGIANAGGAFFQCFAGSGSFTRSAVNYFSGAATRLSGILSGIIVALALVFLGPYAKYIAMPCLSGVIMVIAYNMVNKEEMKKVIRVGKSDAVVMWVTAGATCLMPDLDWAIYMGIFISIALYLKDTNQAPLKILIPSQDKEARFLEKEIGSVKDKVEMLILQLEGNLYFGSAQDLESKLESLASKARVFILRMKITTIDITALDAIKHFIHQVKNAGGHILLCGVRSGLNEMLLHSDLTAEIGTENIFLSEDEVFASSQKALDRANQILESETGTGHQV